MTLGDVMLYNRRKISEFEFTVHTYRADINVNVLQDTTPEREAYLLDKITLALKDISNDYRYEFISHIFPYGETDESYCLLTEEILNKLKSKISEYGFVVFDLKPDLYKYRYDHIKPYVIFDIDQIEPKE